MPRLQDADKKEMKEMNKTAQNYFVQGHKFASAGKWSMAIKVISKGLKLEPKDPIALVNRCTCYAMMNKFPEALRDADQLVGIDPNNHEGYLLAGNVMAEMGLYLHAIETFDKAIAICTNEPATYIGRGNAYSAIGEVHRAYNDYVRALMLLPTLPEAQIGLARSLVELDRLVDAVKVYEGLLSTIDDLTCPIAVNAKAELADVQAKLRGRTP